MKFINIETLESQESTQQTINYSRSDYINIDLPYDDLYLMDTVATDSFDNEPKKIELINPINVQGLDKCYQSLQYFTIDNLFSELQTSVLKELARKNLGINLDTISVQGDIKLGIINLSQLSEVKQIQSELTETNQIAYFIITDNSGKLPSKLTAYSVPTNVVRQLLFASPNPTTLALLDIVASKVSFSPIGVNVGDLIALTRIKVKVSDLTNVIGITIPGTSEIELYLYKILATNDAKPYNYNGITQGVMGLMSPWDKTEVNKISGIKNIANAALPRIDYLPSKWENNMNNCLETGVYPWCTLGRPAGSTGAYTCISIKSSTNDGNYYTIEQTAYGRLNELGQIYKRIIFYKKDGTDTLYHDWINISDSFKTNYYTKDESVELFAKKTSVEANNEKISKILSGETPVEKADKLTTKRTISLSGYAVSNTPYFDGSSNVTISVNSINDRGLLLGLSAKEGDYYRAKMTPIDTANLEFSTNRLAFNNPECITIEYSNDGGNTWLDYEATDILKIGFISGIETPFFLGKNITALTANQDMLRIKINHNRGAYTNMQRLYIYLSTQGAMVDNSHSLLCKVEKSLCKDPENLSLVGNYLVSGWSGWNSINIDGYFGSVSDNNIHTIQLTFSFNNLSSAYISKTKAKIMKLQMLGNTVFTNSTGCKLLQTGHIYDYDLYKNVIFPAKLTSTILESNIETGTAPIKVKSTTKVSNLKSEYSEKDVNGNVIHTTYATKSEVENEINRAEKIVRKEDIVNNLTDGGADKALSAEMGKELGKHNGFSVELKEVANSASYIIITDVIKGGTILKLTVHSSNEGRITVEANKTSDSSNVKLLDYIAIDSVYMIYLEEDVRKLKLVNYTGAAANISADIQYTENPVYHNLPYEIIGYRGSGLKLTTSRYVDIKIGDGLRNMGTSNVILVSADGTEYNLAPLEYYSISPINAVSLKVPAHGSQSYHINVYPKTVFKSKGEDLEERISAEQCLFFRTNLFDEKAVTNGAYLNGAGNEIATNSFFISDYIPFKEWMGALVISTENSAGVRSLFFQDTNKIGGFTVLYDKDKNVHSAFIPEEKDGYLTWEAGVAFVRISFKITMHRPLIEIGTIAHEYIPYGEHLLLPNVKYPLAQKSVTTEIIADKAVTVDKTSIGLRSSANLFNHRDSDIVLNKYGYQASNGTYAMGTSKSLFITGFIAVEENKTYVGIKKHSVAFFDKDKTYITDSYTTGISPADYIINVPVGAAYMRLNMYMDGLPTARIYEGTILGAYTPYGIETSDEFIVKSSVLNDSVFSSLESMSSGEFITLDFPHSLKTNKYSFEANLTTWGGGITIGRGFTAYNSSYFVIDNTNIIHKTYDGSVTVNETVAHGLRLETFVKVFISENNTDDCLVVVQTLTGTFEYTFKYQYKWNGAVKVQSNGAELTNCKLSATNPTLKKSVWMFGDSYFGADGDNRQMYWLKKWGFIDNVLVQSYAGQGSAAAYSDLERCLLLGSPKYIVWCLGMNDDNGSDLSDITTGNWYKIFEKVKYTCDIKGITLILATIPNVRGTNYRNKDAMSDIVRNSGQRYIDVAKAVGSSSEGTWYGDGTDYDYQSTDNVHPTMYGAQAIATQILVDFPEIMQY